MKEVGNDAKQQKQMKKFENTKVVIRNLTSTKNLEYND
jgi:hypothetical protein